MRRKYIFLATVVVGLLLAGAGGAQVSGQVDIRYSSGYDPYDSYDYYEPPVEVGFFYEELSPYGEWFYTSEYGWAWFPNDVHYSWRPYTLGRWVFTDYGWTWVSHEPFGWATYHYGRWAQHPRFGWVWVPGTIWGPAWVSWRQGYGYIGWAPLPPTVGFEFGLGLRFGGFDLNVVLRPDHYAFVPMRSFLDSRVSSRMLPAARNVTIIENTTNITNYTYVDNRVVNRGIDPARVERSTGRRVQRLRVAEQPVQTRAAARERIQGGEVRIYRPSKSRLETVRVAERNNKGIAPGAVPKAQRTPRAEAESRTGERNRSEPEIVVAPRAKPVPQGEVERLQRSERREQEELRNYQQQEQRRLEKMQREPAPREEQNGKRKSASPADQAPGEKAPVVENAKSREAERRALEEQQQLQERQLEERQKIRREAAQATEQRGRASGQKAGAKGEDSQKGNSQEQKKKGQEKKPQPPPPDGAD